jgi:hypothetical protein
LKLEQKSVGDLKTKTFVNHKARPFFRIMAPFKLFRMKESTSRSTSREENEPDQPSNLVITTTSLNKLTTVMTSSSAHYLNVDESDQTSESSLMSLNNDQRALLSSGSTVDQIGKLSFSYSKIPSKFPYTKKVVFSCKFIDFSFDVEKEIFLFEKSFNMF